VGAFYARWAREGTQILQDYTSKSVETIRGHPSAAHVLARRVAVLGEEVVAEVGVKVGAKVDVPQLGLRLVFFSLYPVQSGSTREICKGS
jgi:hypothetical protein